MAKQKDIPDLAVLTGWLTFAKDISRATHWDFFVIDQMLRGNQDIKGSITDNTLEVSKGTDSLNFPINKLWSNFRAVRSFVTRHEPVVKVRVEEFDEQAKQYARRANAILKRDNKLNNSRKLNKEWVYYGIKYGIGYRQVGYDPIKKVSIRWTIDPFDLLPGSKTGKFEDAPFVIKTVVRTVAYWRHKYPKANIVPDNEVASDEFKKLALEIDLQAGTTATQRVEEQTAIGYECWYRLYEKNSVGGLINKCLFTKTEILDTQETPFNEYPFIPYEADITPNEMYPEGHIKHIIPAQRMLNLLNTQLLEYNHIVNKGRYQVDKDAGFQNIFAKEGQIIRVNTGKRVVPLNPPAINPMLQWQINYADDAIKVIGSQNDASRGTNPTGVTSGVALQSLQAADSNNVSDLRDNFEDALALEAQMILNMYALFENEGVVVTDQQKNGEVDQFAAVSQNYQPANYNGEQVYIDDNGGYLDYVQVTTDNKVEVSVTSELGETKEERMNLLFKLVEAGMPIKYLFELLQLPNGDEIMERIADENLAEITQNQQMQAQQGPQQAPPGGNVPVPIPDAQMMAVAGQ